MKCIYKITISDWIYVGQTINFSKRKAVHLWSLERNRHSNPILQNCYNKYGKHSLTFSVLEECENLTERENFWIEHYSTTNKLLNICTPCAPAAGQPRSEETRLKLSAAKLGRTVSSETREKISLSLRQKNLGGFRGYHPCPYCGQQRAERYRSNGAFLGYHKTCRKKECKNSR